MWRAFILFIIFILSTIRAAPATSGPLMEDPLFAISYDPQEVNFETAPAVIGQSCPSFRGRKLWVFAHFQGSDTEFFIVSGFVKTHLEGPAPLSPDFGAAIALRGNECRRDPLDWFWSGKANPGNLKPIRVSTAELDGLAEDALQRYSTAFGGKESFLRAIRSRKHYVDLYPVLTKHLEQFMKEPSGFSEGGSPDLGAARVPQPDAAPSISTNSDAFLVKAIVSTHTRERGKRRDTCIDVDVRTADGRFSLARASHKECSLNDVTRYAPGSTHSFDLVVGDGITRKDAHGYKVRIGDETNVADPWTFDVKVTLYFSDGSRLTASRENITVSPNDYDFSSDTSD
jgi:hypothetical protein